MAVQLVSLFGFGLVVTFSVLLGIIRASEFKEKQLRSGAPETDDGLAAAPAPRLVTGKPVA